MKKLFTLAVCLILLLCTLFIANKSIDVKASAVVSDLNSDTYILLDKASGEIIVENNAHEKKPVASICKLMTSLITLERIEKGALSLTDELIASSYACSMEGSQAFLDEGCKYKVSDLLKSVVVASANDSSVVLAEAIAGSEKDFVKLMNERAKELGMNDTFYENANGLPTPNQYSTAFDTSIILKEISKYDLYNEYSNIWMDKLIHPSGRETELVNTNRLIKYYDYCLNGKTGFTDEAGYCLASTASNNGLTLISVVLNCSDAASRFSDSVKLYNYGFANYENLQIVYKGKPLEDNLRISGGKSNTAKVAPNSDFYILNKKGENENVSIKFVMEDTIVAPLKKGDVVGHGIIINNGKISGEVDIVSIEDVEKQNIFDIFDKVKINWNIV